MIFWAVIAIVHGILFYRRWQEREQLAVELRSRLSEAQLDVLKGQLRPHFLFNTLNSISTLVHSDPASADRMVVQLADLLRASLETSGKHEIPLAEELALLERYRRHHARAARGSAHGDDPRDSPARAPRSCRTSFFSRSWRTPSSTASAAAPAPGGIVIDAAEVERQLYLRVGDDGGGHRHRARTGGLAPDEGVGPRQHASALCVNSTARRTRSRSICAENGGTLVTIAIPLRKPARRARALDALAS